MPRKLRKLLEGAMQRSKSVVSVAALSDGIEAEDDEEDEEAGEDLRPSVALCRSSAANSAFHGEVVSPEAKSWIITSDGSKVFSERQKMPELLLNTEIR